MNTTTNNAAAYTLRPEVCEDYPVGPAIMERVDTRLTGGGYVFRYAPVTEHGVDMSMAFWDDFSEVVTLDEARALREVA